LYCSERYTAEIRTSKNSKIMLSVPIVPHSDSGYEDEILRLLCPSETDFVVASVSEEEYNQIVEDVRYINDYDDDYDRRSSDEYEEGMRSGADSDMIHDTFFADVREIEEQDEMKRATSRLGRIEEEVRTNVFCHDHKPTVSLEMNQVLRPQQTTERQMYLKTDSHYSNTCVTNFPSNSFEEGIRRAIKTARQVPVYTIQHSNSNESSESIFSTSTNRSGASYSSASIMKLKARKRMLEKHHSRSNILKGSLSLDQGEISRRNHRSMVAAAV